ncbi:hypothetical protein V5799_011617 [Amblyomma americanum]|uniref:Fucosyltransferase n=1 Tax=Amblyomma americanum TaxID=6943 RepID=A0AAQ4EGR7_AMBAM
MTAQQPELSTRRDDGGEDLDVFKALSDNRRCSEPQQSARIEPQEAPADGPHSQEPVPPGGERPLDLAPCEQSLSTDDFLPSSFTRHLAKCCNKRKSRCCLLVGLAWAVVAASVLLLVTISLRSSPVPVTTLPSPTRLPWRDRMKENGIPRLLLWNSGESRKPPFLTDVFDDDDHSMFNSTLCYVDGSREPDECEITTDRNQLMKSDAVVFYSENLGIDDAPPWRAVDQLWVLWARQQPPPLGKGGPANNRSRSLPVAEQVFNWTMAKREDADVVISHETFRCQESGGKPIVNPPDRQGNRHFLVQKRGVAWILDDCEKNRYISEMKISRRGKKKSGEAGSTMLLRLFPACGATLCASPIECVRYIAERYYFIVVTLRPGCFQTAYEVIYEAFKYDLVPIVLMPHNGTLNVPKRSVITSAKLQAKGQLAKYLESVLDNPKKYEGFFTWKRRCWVIPPPDNFCALCHAMWDIPMRQRPHTNVREWWTRFTSCTGEPLYGLDSAFVQEL